METLEATLDKKTNTNSQNTMQSYAKRYYNELLTNIIPFWEQHSIDKEFGGFFTCLDRQGKVYDTDKFMWLQGRQVWTFSMLYDKVQANENWKKIALHGADFMLKNGRDDAGNWYFSLNQQGLPLVQPYNIFSDCFATMGFAALHKIQPKDEYATVANFTFNNIIKRRENWKGVYSKAYPNTRNLKNFSLPMILCNLALELEHIIGTKAVDEFIPEVVHEVMNVFYKPDLGVILENVQTDGTFSDSYEGRILNPGHAIEAMWFIMDLGKRMNDEVLINKACTIMLETLEYGWDKEFGGIYYFLDVKGNPTQQLEWDQKLWWVHVETLVALAKGYAYTKNEKCREWFTIIHNYTWAKFKDPEYLEWFGYLNRRGEVLLPLKGGKWKGCFHNPRAMYQVWKTLESLNF